MEGSRPCESCRKRTLVVDNLTGSMVCSSCGIIQSFDNFQHSFGGFDGPSGTFIRAGTAGSGSSYNYKETKIYKAKEIVQKITSLLDISPAKSEDIRIMVDKVTEGEYGQGDWFPVLVGACAYVVMRKENKSIPLNDIVGKVDCDVHELGRMVSRVVKHLDLKLPEVDIVRLFERALRSCFGVTVEEETVERMLKQGIFLVQCVEKWHLTTGRRPLPVIVAVLVFVAQLNELDDARVEDLAKELHVVVDTSKKRYKELLEHLVKVGQALPWGKDITVKNIVKNAPFVMQYMELKSMSKPGGERNSSEHIGFDLDDLVGECYSKEIEYGVERNTEANDSQYFEAEDKGASRIWNNDDLDLLKMSHECLTMVYTEFSNQVSEISTSEESGHNNRRKRGKRFDLFDCRDWWMGKSEMSKKLLIKQICEKDVGLDVPPPSFRAGCLAYKKRRAKIAAAKARINKTMCLPSAGLGDSSEPSLAEPSSVGKKRRRKKKNVDVNWEDLIIETLLLHGVEEKEIEKGHYNTLLDLHVFDSGDLCEGCKRKK